jgi:hypothetical protein
MPDPLEVLKDLKKRFPDDFDSVSISWAKDHSVDYDPAQYQKKNSGSKHTSDKPSTSDTNDEQKNASPSPHPSQKSSFNWMVGGLMLAALGGGVWWLLGNNDKQTE